MMKTAAILLVVLQVAIGANLPDKFKRCHVKQPDSSTCFNAAIADALRKIGTTGIPSLNMGPLQPMTVKELKIDQGRNGPVVVKLHFTNVKLYGIPDSSIDGFRMDNYELKAESLTPEFKLDADYTLEGQILLLPIRGTGRCTISLESVTTHHHITGKPVTRDGETYLDLQNYDIKMNVKHMHMNFRNLFNGDKALGETMNKVINENWELIMNEIKPALEKSFGDVFLEYSKGIFDKVPFDSIFIQQTTLQ